MALADFILMLVSSMLVSNSKGVSAFGAIGSEVPRSRRPKEEEYCEEWLTVSALEQGELVAAEPIDYASDSSQEIQEKEDVSFKWTFWYDDTTSKKKLNKKDYLHNLHRLTTVSTLPEFTAEWKNIHEKLIPVFEPETNFRFFHHDILPMWEDSHNTEGGKWVVVFRQKPGSKTLELWRSLLLSMMLGELGHHEDICGAVLSVRSWGYMFTIWNKDYQNVSQIEDVARKLERVFGTPKIKYQSHKDAIQKTSAATKKQQLIEKNLKKAKKQQEKENRSNNIKSPVLSERKKEYKAPEAEPAVRIQPKFEDVENIGDQEKNLNAGISSDNESAEASVIPTEAEEQVETSVQESMDGDDEKKEPATLSTPENIPTPSEPESITLPQDTPTSSETVASELVPQEPQTQLSFPMQTAPALANFTRIAVAAVSGMLLGWTVAVSTTL